MPLVTMRQILDHAAENNYGVPAFNINDMEQVIAVLQAARKVNAPVILQTSTGARKFAGDPMIRHMVQAGIEMFPELPICIHQDHGSSVDICQSAIVNGYSSVMMDGSLEADGKTPSSFEYNVHVTKEVVARAHAVGASVEGELGVIGSLETGKGDKEEAAIVKAQNGTLFINEICDMPMEAQTRLLQVLQKGEFLPVGEQKPHKVNVRIIAATSRILENLVKEGTFISDLYYRLNVIHINMPPLRDRNNDIPMLAKHFLNQSAIENNTEPKKLTSEVLVFLCRQQWPGNVRQLKNLCKYLTIMVTGRDIQLSDLPAEFLQARNAQPKATTSISGTSKEPVSWQEQLRNWVDGRLKAGERDILSEATPEFERVMLEAALA